MTLRECIDLLFEDTGSSFAYSLAKELQTNLSNSKRKINNSYNGFVQDFVRNRLTKLSNTKDINNNLVKDLFNYDNYFVFENEVLNYFRLKFPKLLKQYLNVIKRASKLYYDQK